MITITWRFTFFDSWAASAGVIGAVAMLWAAGAATATADWPTTRAGTAAAAAIREMTLLRAGARSVPPVMRPCMLPHLGGGRG